MAAQAEFHEAHTNLSTVEAVDDAAQDSSSREAPRPSDLQALKMFQACWETMAVDAKGMPDVGVDSAIEQIELEFKKAGAPTTALPPGVVSMACPVMASQVGSKRAEALRLQTMLKDTHEKQ